MCVRILLGTLGCSRSSDESPSGVSAASETMALKLNALNYTDDPIGAFYVDGRWGGAVPSRVGSGGGAKSERHRRINLKGGAMTLDR